MKNTQRHIGRSNKDTNPGKRQRCYNRLQQYDNSQPVGGLGLQNLTDDDDGNEEQIFLRQYKEEFLEKELEPEDTLQTLSIQFNCPIAELKRINNIHRDNEVFARRIIKVPVKYFSLLSDNVGVHKNPVTGKNNPSSSSLALAIEDHPSSSSSQPTTVLSSLSSSIRPTHISGIDFLSNGGASTAANQMPPHDIEDLDTTRLLSTDKNAMERDPLEVFQCSGSDWGLSWLQLLSFTLLLVLGGPILYLLYHAKESSHNLISLNMTTNP